MIHWIALLISCCCLNGAAGESPQLERIKRCQTRCSQGLSCKTRPDYWFPPACKDPAEGLNITSVIHNVSVSTVMKCEDKQKCRLHLKIHTVVQLMDSVSGVSICTSSAGMMTKCQIVQFTKASRRSMSGLLVTVENDYTEVSPNQHLQVIVKTVPSYCGITWVSNYRTPVCSHEDLRKNVPECITGKLSYTASPEKKELAVSVSDMLQGYNYNLRLCLKDFICSGTGASTVIKKEEPLKTAVLQYSRPLPCLCIEGWSSFIDAPRVQVCPFKDRQDELWFGITFDPLEEALIWEPACPVAAVACLCEKREDGACVDLPDSSQKVSRQKITFAKVDPHPQLCMKFTVGSQSWTQCPFADGIKVWDVIVSRDHGHEELQILSRVTAKFSVGPWGTSAESPVNQTTYAILVDVEKQKPVDLQLRGKQCNFCQQVKRVDVKYAATVVHCTKRCMSKSSSPTPPYDLTRIILPAAACLSGIIIVTLVLWLLLRVYRSRKGRTGVCLSEKTDANVFDVQTQLPVSRRAFTTSEAKSGNNEKANLLLN
ncbi:putative interleukin-17 receptor E-like [Poeciliopsis prolifica]|uniref:putative interleukin-17 receptor E-like n=1 Tax=Poeciliopsis prolifica TaxID=188132 RepID=UPI00241444B3|nr:putative interleukin-17 receptor E-like [Poeciliopsis prolifica]